jgi:hypothetical protein
VAGIGVEKPDVAVDVVGDLPVELAHQNRFEQPAGPDVLALVGGPPSPPNGDYERGPDCCSDQSNMPLSRLCLAMP